MDSLTLPDFDALPPVGKIPRGCAWGLFDENGVKDSVGTLNLLTPKVVREAAKEIIVGESVVLNWNLEKPVEPFFREKFQHRLRDNGKETGFPYCSYDDVVTLNTQGSSQWDGLRHWGHFSTRQYYNGVSHEDIVKPGCSDNGIHHWSERGGIVGRGILVDYASWAEQQGIELKPSVQHQITLQDIQTILGEQGVTPRPGDILVIRSGLIAMYERCKTDKERNALIHSPLQMGVEASEDLLRWLWDRHFAAVAGDAVAFESQPFPEEFCLHDYLLVCWGMPIGELWTLEKLADKCKEHKRWTFFLTSAPLNIDGGAASPPNALAIF